VTDVNERDNRGESVIESAHSLHRANPELVATVLVRPNWQVCAAGKAYRGGELVTLPILRAAEHLAWGSVELPPRTSGSTPELPPEQPAAKK
jgi:hypothetical protein